jgi:2-amino-4-hydroxy-6-hydroxymethyldihydropteridine diphosphokinase
LKGAASGDERAGSEQVMSAANTRLPAGTDCIIALGSNLGDKTGNIARAIELLTEAGDVRLIARSRNFATAPWGKTDQDWFVNACISVATKLPPRALLQRCQEVEGRMGRVRSEKWGPRIIDVDLLVYRDVAVNEPDLVLPHPHMSERAFVLAPLIDIAPSLKIAGKGVRELYAAIDHSDVRALD